LTPFLLFVCFQSERFLNKEKKISIMPNYFSFSFFFLSKDAVFMPGAACERFKPMFAEALKKVPEGDKVAEFRTLMTVATEALCVRTGREAMG
jgi:hypothetical protein